MNETTTFRVLSFLNDASKNHAASIAKEKRKVTVIGEEHEPDEIQEEKPSSNVNNTEAPLLTSEQIKEFFKAIQESSIERIDELFDAITNVDPNMTYYAESLLMAAIRAKRHKVAEYLIDQLGIDVNYSTDLLEFRTRTANPIQERTLTCRDLAYEKGMMDLVDLIDITSDEVKPSIKRYLQRRIKARLEEIHQSYIKRMKERNNRLIIQSQERENKLFEEDEQEKENQELLNSNVIDEIGPMLSPPPPPVIPRSYKSHIEETIQNIASTTDSSIDDTGKKTFRYSGYTLRFRLEETDNSKKQKKEQSRPKSTPPPQPFAFPITPSSTLPTIQPARSTLSRPRTTINIKRQSMNEISSQIPIRETRTSICRSARRLSTPRISQIVNAESKSEVKPIPTTTINPPQRLLPKRSLHINRNYSYIPQFHNTIYTGSHLSVPITLKATAIGLPSDTRLVRD